MDAPCLYLSNSTSSPPQVISTAMHKTVVVAVDRVAVVPKYRVRVRRTKKYMAHDEAGAAALGDTVRIDACRPLSKYKSWTLGAVLRRERRLEGGEGEGAAVAVAPPPPPRRAREAAGRGFAAGG